MGILKAPYQNRKAPVSRGPPLITESTLSKTCAGQPSIPKGVEVVADKLNLFAFYSFSFSPDTQPAN